VLPFAPPVPALFCAALASWLLVGALLPLLRARLLDHPNARSSHRRPTPRGGGAAFVLVAAACSMLALLSGGGGDLPSSRALSALPLATLPLALVGFLDDRHDLPAAGRYGAQLATALLLLLLSPLARALPLALPGAGALVWPLAALLLIAITAVINFTNFMDGLDGLVAGSMAVALAAAALDLSAPWPLWALVGAVAGFLLWNWSPARVFMGDGGSTALGALFAGVVLQAASWSQALGLLLVATPLLGDACLCVLRRLRAGQPVLQAHRLHLYQRLHQAGWSHARVAALYIGATALLAAAQLLGGWCWVLPLALAELAAGLWLDRAVAMPFAASCSP
jgi:UDP-N-acetylmuramyl pentapeptide phosphotransferase/UDP-N-acetylglucosamine-1-phosphate transferase